MLKIFIKNFASQHQSHFVQKWSHKVSRPPTGAFHSRRFYIGNANKKIKRGGVIAATNVECDSRQLGEQGSFREMKGSADICATLRLALTRLASENISFHYFWIAFSYLVHVAVDFLQMCLRVKLKNKTNGKVGSRWQRDLSEQGRWRWKIAEK